MLRYPASLGKNKRNSFEYLSDKPKTAGLLSAQKRTVKASRWIPKCVYGVWMEQPSVRVEDAAALPGYTWVRKWWPTWSGCLLRSGMNHRSFQRVPQTSASAHCQVFLEPYLTGKISGTSAYNLSIHQIWSFGSNIYVGVWKFKTKKQKNNHFLFMFV